MAAFGTFLPGAAGSPLGPGPTQATSVLRIGALQQPDSLNVFVGVETASYNIWAHVYELLVGIGPDTRPVPALAKDWSNVGNVWTFHLQNNVTWHDGVEFTSEDVNFTFRYIYPVTPQNPNGCDLTLLQGYIGDYSRHVGVDVGNITTPDKYTVVIPTFQGKANILSMFVQILPKHIWSGISCQHATHVQPTPMVGTGMYKFVEWVQGSYVRLALNTNYWRLDKALVAQDKYVGELLYTYYANSALLYHDFETGLIDATGALGAKEFLTLQGSGMAGVLYLRTPGNQMDEMGACLASDQLMRDHLNGKVGNRNWLVTNQTIRQAMQLAVDRQFLVDNILGTQQPGSGLGEPGSSLIPPALPFWHLNATSLDYNVARARQLLDDPKGDGAPLKQGATDPGKYGQNLDPADPLNKDAFAAINPAYPNIRVPVDPSQVQTGEEWGATGGASAPNRAAPYPLSFVLDAIDTETQARDAAARMIQYWNEIGIQVTLSVVSESKMISVTYACDEDFYLWSWGGDIDPDFILSVMTSGQILYWQDAWYANNTYDEDYALQQTQVNPYDRQATIWRMQQKLYDDAAYLIMWYDDFLSVVRSDRFTGWQDWGLWIENPGLDIAGYGNDLLMLNLRVAGTPTQNNCPTKPTIAGTPPISAFTNTTVVFSGSSTDPDSGQTLSWKWAWGDTAQTFNTTSTAVTQTNANHSWSLPASYNITLTVSDGTCTVGSDPFQVNVRAQTAVGYLAGTVTDAASHLALEGASVSAAPGNWANVTDAQGRYNVSLPPGTYTVTATKDLYAPASASGKVVTLQATTVVDLALDPIRGWVAGTVTSSAGGGALQGAAIYVVNGSKEYAASTDAQGKYNVSVPPGIYKVNATLSGYYVKEVTGKPVSTDQTTVVDFVLDPLPEELAGPPVWLLATIVVVVLAAGIGATVFIVRRRRQKAEEIVGPSLPPPKQPGTP